MKKLFFITSTWFSLIFLQSLSEITQNNRGGFEPISNIITSQDFHNDYHILEEVLKSYIELHTADNKEIKVNVTSVIKINDSLENKLKKILSKNGKLKVKIINLIDKDLLGGLIIQIGSNLIDTSIKTKLNKVKNAMKGAN